MPALLSTPTHDAQRCSSAARSVRMTLRYLLVCCGLPILLGGLIYILFRDTDMWMFRWADAVGISGAISAARGAAAPLAPHLPAVVLYSLPDGAWVLACTALFARLWSDGPLWMRLAWISVCPVLAIGSELAQLAGWIRGTFDTWDVLLIALATAGGLLLARQAPPPPATPPPAAAPR